MSNGKVPSCKSGECGRPDQATIRHGSLPTCARCATPPRSGTTSSRPGPTTRATSSRKPRTGPRLPGLPILAAYVRACEGDVLEWEERWRRLDPEVPDDPDLPVRPAGASPAAVAGARAGVGVAPPDVYDPERIRAALPGRPWAFGPGQPKSQRTRAARHWPMVPPRLGELRSGPAHGFRREPGIAVRAGGPNSNWDTPADQGITSANGNHSARHASRGPFDAAFTVLSDPAERTGPRRIRTSPGLTAASRNPGRPHRPTAISPGGSRRVPVWRRSRRRHRCRRRSLPSPNGCRGISPKACRQRNGRISGPSQPPQPQPRPTCSRPLRRAGSRSRRSRGRPGPRRPRAQRLRPQKPQKPQNRLGRAATDVAPATAASAQPFGSAGFAGQATGSARDNQPPGPALPGATAGGHRHRRADRQRARAAT